MSTKRRVLFDLQGYSGKKNPHKKKNAIVAEIAAS